MNLLFLNVGRRCELVESFRAALDSRGGGVVYGTDIDPLAPGLQVVDSAHVFPRGDSDEFPDKLIAFCRGRAIDLVIPTIDPDLIRLDRLRERFEKEVPNCRLLLPGSFTLKHSRDKRMTKDLFAALGAEVPEGVDISDLAALSFPVFVKPHDGSAGIGAGVINDVETLTGRLHDNPALMVERVVQGPEITVDVLCDFSGAAFCAVPRKRIKVRSGEVVQGIVERNPLVERLAMKIAEGFQATGPVTVQFRQSGPETFVAMEVNARMGGGLPLAIAAGADWPGWILDLCQGKAPRTDVPILDGLIMTRCDRSFFIKKDADLPIVDELPAALCTELKGWIFDMDDTLYPEKDFVFSGYRAVAERVFADHGVDIEGNLRDQFNRGGRGDLFSKVLGELSLPCDEEYVRSLVRVYREHLPNIRPYVDVVPTLTLLKEKGIRIGLVSDGWLSVQQNKLAALGIGDLFDAVVFTDGINGTASWKPAADGFRACLDRMGVTPEHAVYVGDNPVKDFVGARAVGMKTIRVHRVAAEHVDKAASAPEFDADWALASLKAVGGIYR